MSLGFESPTPGGAGARQAGESRFVSNEETGSKMVAIVSGNSLGLSLTSLVTVGQRGTLGFFGQGRSGEQAFVNIANGNLVLQDFDDRLEGRGLDISAVRTYNSQGLLNADGTHAEHDQRQWRGHRRDQE